jgi:serine/threonine protein phosphatase PrpC
MKLEVGVAERPLHGEDRTLVNLDLNLFGVFDGLGGYPGGAEAAEMAARTVGAYCRGHEPSLTVLAHSVIAANKAMIAAKANQELVGYTTATICWLAPGRLHWVSVGDSRLYHQPSGGRLMPVSRDEGYRNILNNCLGDEYEFKGLRQHSSFVVSHGDKLVLVTDGITGDFKPDLLNPVDLEAAITGRDAQAAAERLIDVARKHDDRSAIVIDIQAESGVEK